MIRDSIITVAAIAIIASTGKVPAASGVKQEARVRIVLVGDSTVAEDSGWGPGFRRLARDGAEVVNVAANGRSSKSFIDEGLWTKALAARGQVLPDSVRPQRRSLEKVRSGKPIRRRPIERSWHATSMNRAAIGAKPVLVTSLVRRIYNTDGTIKTTQTPYVEAVRALAAEKHVPLVDLFAISLADAENAGDDVWADLSPRDDKGQSRSHAFEREGQRRGRPHGGRSPRRSSPRARASLPRGECSKAHRASSFYADRSIRSTMTIWVCHQGHTIFVSSALTV